jgi:hypothetical protein
MRGELSFPVVVSAMDKRAALKLRRSARRFREMAVLGDDERLKASLLQLADEFDVEAKTIVAALTIADDE